MAEMNRINSFKSFTEVRNAEAANKLREENQTKRKELAQKFESILDEMGITSFNELDEETQNNLISKILGKELNERNAFLGARAKAIEEDREEFEFNGKTYKVTTKSNVSEGNAFGDAVRKAKEAGEKEFEFEGKTYKVTEHHTDNPNDKYVVKPCDEEGTPWAVWEGDVRVECFETKEEAEEYAATQNKEQGLEEGNAFGDAVRKAKEAGEKEFEFEGKTYKVTEAITEAIQVQYKRDAKKVVTVYNKIFNKSLVDFGAMSTESILGCIKYLMSEALQDANFHREAEPTAKMIKGNIQPLEIKMPGLGGHFVKIGQKTIKEILDKYYSDIANAAGWGGIGIVEGTALYLEQIKQEAMGQAALNKFNTLFEGEEVRVDVEARINEAKVLEAAAWEIGKDYPSYGVVVSVVNNDDLCEVTFDSGEKIVFRDTGSSWVQEAAVTEGRVKQFEMDLSDMIKDIKRGYGWIDPEYVGDTWENTSDSISFELVKGEIYKRLIAAGLLAYADDENEEEAGKHIKSLKELGIKESVVNEAKFKKGQYIKAKCDSDDFDGDVYDKTNDVDGSEILKNSSFEIYEIGKDEVILWSDADEVEYSIDPDDLKNFVKESVVTEARFVKDFNRDVLKAKTKEEVLELYPNAEFFIGKSDHFFGELDDNLFFKAYYTKAQKEFEIKSVYSQKGSNYVHLYNESVVTEGKTSAVYTDPKTGKGYDLQYVSTKKRWELDIMKKGASMYSNAITTIKRDTLAEIQEWLDGYKIDSSWTKGLSESAVVENINDPVLIAFRAAKMKREKELAKPKRKPLYGKQRQKAEDQLWDISQDLKDLYADRGQLLIDMEEEAEAEGGPVADRYGEELDMIETKIQSLIAQRGKLEMRLAESKGHSTQLNRINESEIVYHKYDFEGMWAQKLGMTREEYVAHFASMNIGVDEAVAKDYTGTQFEVKGISFVYTDTGRFYGAFIYDVPKTANVNKRTKFSLSEITEFLTSNGIKNKVPLRYEEKELESICKKLTKKGIVCDFDDSMDVS